MQRALLVVLALVATVAACGGDGTTSPTPTSLAGTWRVVSVNGSALPYTILGSGDNREDLLDDVITASADGTFTEVTTIQHFSKTLGISTDVSPPLPGTWVLNGTNVTLTYTNDGSQGIGSVNGNTLTFTWAAFRFVFKRQ